MSDEVKERSEAELANKRIAELQELWDESLNWSMLDEKLSEDVADGLMLKLRRSPTLGWMLYTGKVWESVDEEVAKHEVAQRLREEYEHRHDAYRKLIDSLADKTSSQAVEQTKELKALDKSAAQLMGTPLLQRVWTRYKGRATLDAPWDKYKELINCQNGVVDLKQPIGPMRHSADYFFTRITNVPYYPEASLDCGNPEDRWHEARKDIQATLEALPDDAQGFFQSRMGQSLSGYMQQDKQMHVCQGNGGDGKTEIFIAPNLALGSYYVFLPNETLSGDDGHPTERMVLRGARHAVMEEFPEKILNEHALKSFVGTPTISGRKMRADFVAFENQASIWVTCNTLPTVLGTDDGTWRRLLRIPFPYRFRDPGLPTETDEDRTGDPELEYRLLLDDRQEVALAWLIDGARNYYAGVETDIPASVQKATAEWRGDADSIQAYCDQYLEFGPGFAVTTDDLYKDFKYLMSEAGQGVLREKTFTTKFGSHIRVRSNRVVKEQVRDLSKISRRVQRTWKDDPVDDLSTDRPTCWVNVRIKPGIYVDRSTVGTGLREPWMA